MIDLFKPLICEDAIARAAEAMRSGWLGMGPRVEEFEKAFAAYLDVKHTAAVNTCTSALHLAVKLLNLPAGSEVITTPNTFVATNQVLLWEKLKPVFADVEEGSGNIDAASVGRLIGGKTRAIVAVHFGGNPCDLEGLKKFGLAMIEDCAHAAGAFYDGKRVGAHGNLAAFSFGATKNLTTGDGGMLIVQNEQQLETVRRLRYLGLTKDTFNRLNDSPAAHWEYEVPSPGLRYHMNDVAAAMGLGQLPQLDRENERRAQIAAMYGELLKDVVGLTLAKRNPRGRSANYLYFVLAEKRDALAAALLAQKITVSVHYKPNTRYGIFSAAALPGAERFYARELSLPMHPRLTDEQVHQVAAAIRKGWWPMAQPLVILGTRMLAEEMFDLISEMPGYEVTAFIENQERERCGKELESRPILWVDEAAKFAKTHQAICALSTTHRRQYVNQAEALGFKMATLVHPTARVSKRAILAEGCFISALVNISTRTALGKCVFVNRGALIGHHTTIRDFCTIQPAANIAGAITIGEDTYIGMNAGILERLTIGSGCVIAAGALVTEDLPDRVQVMGVPARVTKTGIEAK